MLWNEYIRNITSDPVRKREVQEKVMTLAHKDGNKISMKYGMKVIGESKEDGYPLYIALHGGGQGDTPFINDQQWEHMGIYYADSIKDGIYINPRGIRDTWDCHGNPESYYFYDRLITNMIAFENVNPNKVYLMGFSAGGDGVYMISPKMPDRFAAVHMSAGHPNGISLINLFNTPIMLQVGINDDAYGRNKVTAEYDQYLEELSNRSGNNYKYLRTPEYRHNCFIHIDKPHNFVDYGTQKQRVIADNSLWLKESKVTEKLSDTNAVRFLEQFTRNPLPFHVVWDLSCREKYRNGHNYYWLSAPDNTIRQVKINYSEEVLKETMLSSGDYNYSFVSKIEI